MFVGICTVGGKYELDEGGASGENAGELVLVLADVPASVKALERELLLSEWTGTRAPLMPSPSYTWLPAFALLATLV